eukprot:gnl/Ergobibamus_cyprinoides/1592.p1 GENE.gnl/Ergobibamus_cyprinoides/1592~~gnl/Ergobibamus_cyprinoides/1592.p1  ORF type:complete len:204 (+),score=25.53 gnl/Ergobibamus_cyprinoides/1592:107-718(+)
MLYLPLPEPEARVSILLTAARQTPITPDGLRHLTKLATSHRLDGFSGADCSALVQESARLAIKDNLELVKRTIAGGGVAAAVPAPIVMPRHFDDALLTVSRSVSAADADRYLRVSNTIRGARSHAIAKSDAEPKPSSAVGKKRVQRPVGTTAQPPKPLSPNSRPPQLSPTPLQSPEEPNTAQGDNGFDSTGELDSSSSFDSSV